MTSSSRTRCALLRVTASARAKQSLAHTRLSIEIDRAPYAASWGVNDFMVEPGDHTVDVCFRYCGGARGRASRVVRAVADDVVALAYRAPYFMFFSQGELADDPVH